MMAEIALRFLLGGVLVSVFAVVGEVVRPRSFAGIFGAAPSVALAGLGLACATESAHYAAVESRTMMIGAIALIVYSSTCAILLRSKSMPVWLHAALAWATWFVVAFSLFAIVERV